MTARGPAVLVVLCLGSSFFYPLDCSTERPSCPPVLLSLLSSLSDCFPPATPIETVETIKSLRQISRRSVPCDARGLFSAAAVFCMAVSSVC
ncbi:uncharacterized protein EURHEDRAFT_133815 [Aspergillus ruber CBS 135680]|uniref:Secreted protein n=1 Tax=Aspergillus ruber (strain CBS 135680) TaxID=1388766 RepID=A0A017SQJ9_ASPRC|nr:uncharacterized protein EURHEDRAFT_133815 [Aspergillus ruber CBS 135680]EYE99263.1 hypothetical protein EURHEDRAFT_133815 [Aspergillus ruber CBS 135680]